MIISDAAASNGGCFVCGAALRKHGSRRGRPRRLFLLRRMLGARSCLHLLPRAAGFVAAKTRTRPVCRWR